MGHQKGEYQYLNPNDHVNKCQSTNDAYPTGFRIAVYASILKLIDAIKQLGEGFRESRGVRTSSKWAAPSCRTRCR
ncbi:lyase family protein [Klebsiella pneumoniae]|uniref:lyase family protein n=1 Tax=Klebsiella pneumoniae TaxID=573 RepID=UPI002265C96C|nr:lyase family protein [Klebsiella pneumoniae]